MAFPANVMGVLLPPMTDIPEDFKKWGGNKWVRACETWFNSGVDTEKSTIKFASHLNDEQMNDAMRQLQACLGSYEPKHEHKVAGVAYLMSLFFGELNIVPAPAKG